MLPVLLLCLGDSIRCGWAAYIPCEQPRENCQSTRYAKTQLAAWTGGSSYKVIVFNFGLWDIKEEVPVEEYKRNLNWIIDHLSADRIYFCTTTPGRVDEEMDGKNRPGRKRTPALVEEYNRAAVDVMKARGIKVIDLHDLCMRHREWWHDRDVHYEPQGYKEMAEYIKHAIETPEQKSPGR